MATKTEMLNAKFVVMQCFNMKYAAPRYIPFSNEREMEEYLLATTGPDLISVTYEVREMKVG